MKKLLALLLILLSLLNLAACGESTPADTEVPEAGSEMPTVLNQDEYVLYQNIFFIQSSSPGSFPIQYVIHRFLPIGVEGAVFLNMLILTCL